MGRSYAAMLAYACTCACAWAGSACGRLGFDAEDVAHDAGSGDAATSIDAATPSIAERMRCGGQILLDDGGHDPHDTLHWVHDALGEWLVGAHHYTQDDHRIESHAVTMAGGADPASGSAVFMVQADHVDVFGFEPVAAGYVLGYTDFVLGTADTDLVGSDLLVGSAYPLGPLADGNAPLAHAGDGSLAMIGIVDNNVEAARIGGDASPGSGFTLVADQAEGPDHPQLIAMDAGYAVVWESAAHNGCRLATLAADLSASAGPIDIGVTGCTDPHVAWLPAAQRLVVVGNDVAGGAVFASVWAPSLAPIVAPATLGGSAHWARIVTDPDGESAWVTWAVNPSPQAVQYALIDSGAHVVKLGTPVGALDETLGHFHSMDRVGTTVVVMWTDTINARTFSVERLCK